MLEGFRLVGERDMIIRAKELSREKVMSCPHEVRRETVTLRKII